MKRNPFCVVCEHKPGRYDKLCKVDWVDADLFVPLEVQSRRLEQVDRLWREHVLPTTPNPHPHPHSARVRIPTVHAYYSRQVEPEVELPCADVGRVFAGLVREGNANLDDLEEVDVTAHGLVMVVAWRAKRAYGPRNDAGELGVLQQRTYGGSDACRRARADKDPIPLQYTDSVLPSRGLLASLARGWSPIRRVFGT